MWLYAEYIVKTQCLRLIDRQSTMYHSACFQTGIWEREKKVTVLPTVSLWADNTHFQCIEI